MTKTAMSRSRTSLAWGPASTGPCMGPCKHRALGMGPSQCHMQCTRSHVVHYCNAYLLQHENSMATSWNHRISCIVGLSYDCSYVYCHVRCAVMNTLEAGCRVQAGHNYFSCQLQYEQWASYLY